MSSQGSSFFGKTNKFEREEENLVEGRKGKTLVEESNQGIFYWYYRFVGSGPRKLHVGFLSLAQ